MTEHAIVELQVADLAQLEALLRFNHLPAEDCAGKANLFYGIFEAQELIAAGGLEVAADDALLRSVVVHERLRSRGLAGSICEHLIARALSDRRKAIYLLTETAESYFEKLGFEQITRSQVPVAIAATPQFTSLCPDSASCLKMSLYAE
jgi:amino-acid N-acetyltransferase